MEVTAFCTATWQITPSGMAGKPNFCGDYNLVVFSLYIISSVYNLSTNIVLQQGF